MVGENEFSIETNSFPGDTRHERTWGGAEIDAAFDIVPKLELLCQLEQLVGGTGAVTCRSLMRIKFRGRECIASSGRRTFLLC